MGYQNYASDQASTVPDWQPALFKQLISDKIMHALEDTHVSINEYQLAIWFNELIRAYDGEKDEICRVKILGYLVQMMQPFSERMVEGVELKAELEILDTLMTAYRIIKKMDPDKLKNWLSVIPGSKGRSYTR